MTKPATKKKILIVEDDAAICEVLKDMLESDGYEVSTAEHAFAAICAMVRAGADLVLTDIRMPIVNGYDLVKELKTHADTRHVPVVAVSGLDTPESRAAATKAGCVGFIAKPINAAEFSKQIGEFLRSHSK